MVENNKAMCWCIHRVKQQVANVTVEKIDWSCCGSSMQSHADTLLHADNLSHVNKLSHVGTLTHVDTLLHAHTLSHADTLSHDDTLSHADTLSNNDPLLRIVRRKSSLL